MIYCKNNCSGHGVCNDVMGTCGCYENYFGEDCSEENPPLVLSSEMGKIKNVSKATS